MGPAVHYIVGKAQKDTIMQPHSDPYYKANSKILIHQKDVLNRGSMDAINEIDINKIVKSLRNFMNDNNMSFIQISYRDFYILQEFCLLVDHPYQLFQM